MKFSFVIMSLCFIMGCGEPPEMGHFPLSSAARPLFEFGQERLVISEGEDACVKIEDFFLAYSAKYLSDGDVAIVCENVSKESVFTHSEQEEIGRDQLFCGNDRDCFKAVFTVSYAASVDRYYPMVAVFTNGRTAGTILGSRRNRNPLPFGKSKVYPGNLLHDGLAPLLNTFKSWVSI